MARTGLSTNEVELDKQFSDLRRAASLQQSTSTTGSSELPLSSGAIAVRGLITGMRIDRNIIGGFGVKWNTIHPQPSYVEIEVCTDLTFISSKTETFRVDGVDTSFVFGAGLPDVTYFVRVRANYAGSPSTWSSPFNSQTGKAVAANILDGAASSRLRVEFNSFNPAMLGQDVPGGMTDWQATYANTQLKTHGQVVIVFAIVEFDWLIPTLHVTDVPETHINIELMEDGASIFEYQNVKTEEIWYGGGTTGRTAGSSTVPFVAIPASPVAGAHEYSIQATVTTDGSAYNSTVPFYISITRIVMAFVELIR